MKIDDLGAVMIPDGVGENATIVDNKIIFVSIDRDDSCENPLDCDGMGKLYSFNTRHRNYINVHDRERFLEDNRYAVPLSYYEHGNCLWFVRGSRNDVPDMQWDGVRDAGVWVPDDSCLAHIMSKPNNERGAEAIRCAKQAGEVYSQWCNGECYSYNVEVFRVLYSGEDRVVLDELNDYRYCKALFDDACSGYIGYEYTVEEVKTVLARLERDWKELV